VLQAALPQPAVEQRPVEIDQPFPGRGVRLFAKVCQQGGGSFEHFSPDDWIMPFSGQGFKDIPGNRGGPIGLRKHAPSASLIAEPIRGGHHE
jgi:hypothetical protein